MSTGGGASLELLEGKVSLSLSQLVTNASRPLRCMLKYAGSNAQVSADMVSVVYVPAFIAQELPGITALSDA